MADVPRDPRQLARDILSGKVKIEDLARERQARGGAPAGPRVPERIPLPRQAPTPPPQRAQPQRPMSMPPARRTPPPVRAPQAARNPRPAEQARPRAEQVREAVDIPKEQAQAYALPASPVTAAARPQQSSGRGLRLHDLVKSRKAVRQGILLAEVLGKPVGLRD